MLVALLIAALAPARADQWTVEKAGFNLYRITGRTIGGQNVFIRTQGCDDAPAAGVVNVQKDGGTPPSKPAFFNPAQNFARKITDKARTGTRKSGCLESIQAEPSWGAPL